MFIYMRMLFKILLLSFILITATSCKAQLVQTVADAKKLEIGKDKFIGKPLKDLLKEIKPPIKRAVLQPGGMEGVNNYVIFNFISDSDYNKYKSETGKIPVTIRINVKEYNFKWDPSNKPKNERFNWTKEDEEKYGNLTVTWIRVSGSN